MEEKQRLILASASPRRKEILSLLGLPFETRPGTFIEPKRTGQNVFDYVLDLAKAKGRHVKAKEEELILSADTLVHLNGQILGKPASDEEAHQTLAALRGRDHEVYTALFLRDVSAGKTCQSVCRTLVTMRDWSMAEAQAYICTGSYRDKAGGYAIQDDVFHPVSKIEGCYANVMGLPLCHLKGMLEVFGLYTTVNLEEACQAYTRSTCDIYSELLEHPQWECVKG